MRTFHIFKVNNSVCNLTYEHSHVLFNSFLKIKNLDKSDLASALSLFEQLAVPFNKNSFCKKIYNYYKECSFYSMYRCDHSYINRYRDEDSRLKVKHSYIELKTNKENPEFFKFLRKQNDLFICDFENMDYFWANRI